MNRRSFLGTLTTGFAALFMPAPKTTPPPVIEETEEREERQLQKPTHTNYKKMLQDVYAFSEKNPNSIILPADDPFSLLVGYVVYWTHNNGKETAGYFSCRITSLKNLPKPLSSLVETPEGRAKLSKKTFLKNIIRS